MGPFKMAPSKYPSCSHSSSPRRKRKNVADDGPRRKNKRAADQVAARLRNFHISPPQQNGVGEPFFMNSRNESFQDIEDRMSVSSDEEESSSDEETDSLKLSPELKELIKKQKRVMGPSIRQPDSSLAVVLWQPKDTFVDDILSKVQSQRIVDVTDDPFNVFMPQSNTQPRITFPDESNSGGRRRKHKSESDIPTSPSPIIEEVSFDVFETDQCEPMEM